MIYYTVVKILLFVDIFFLLYVFLSIKDTTVCLEMEHKKQIEVYTKKKEVKKKLPFVRV